MVKKRGINSIYKRCLYGKIILEHEIEYTKQFFEKYKNNQKYFRLIIRDTHDSGAVHLMIDSSDL